MTPFISHNNFWYPITMTCQYRDMPARTSIANLTHLPTRSIQFSSFLRHCWAGWVTHNRTSSIKSRLQLNLRPEKCWGKQQTNLGSESTPSIFSRISKDSVRSSVFCLLAFKDTIKMIWMCLCFSRRIQVQVENWNGFLMPLPRRGARVSQNGATTLGQQRSVSKLWRRWLTLLFMPIELRYTHIIAGVCKSVHSKKNPTFIDLQMTDYFNTTWLICGFYVIQSGDEYLYCDGFDYIFKPFNLRLVLEFFKN